MNQQGSQEDAAADPRGAAGGRGGGYTVATPPASIPDKSMIPSASGSLALTEASPPQTSDPT